MGMFFLRQSAFDAGLNKLLSELELGFQTVICCLVCRLFAPL